MVLQEKKKTPRHFMNIRERPLTVHEDKGLETNALKHDRTHLLGVHNRLNVYINKESFQQCTWGDTLESFHKFWPLLNLFVLTSCL